MVSLEQLPSSGTGLLNDELLYAQIESDSRQNLNALCSLLESESVAGDGAYDCLEPVQLQDLVF